MLLPFLNNRFPKDKFNSPQATKRKVAYQLNKELIIGTFVQNYESVENKEQLKQVADAYISL